MTSPASGARLERSLPCLVDPSLGVEGAAELGGDARERGGVADPLKRLAAASKDRLRRLSWSSSRWTRARILPLVLARL